MKAVSIPSFGQRICVKPPYFAFTRLTVDQQTVSGEFVPEQPLGFSRGPITTAEAGRHLAILGSCAAALAQPEPTYYLATKARYHRFGSSATISAATPLQATAEVLEQSRRAVTAHATLASGAPFAHLSVGYQVLSAATFERLFEGYRTDENPQPGKSPYTCAPVMTFTANDGQSLTAVASLTAGQCAGHFPHYPVWPVAIIGYYSEHVIERLFHHIVGQKAEYAIQACTVSAERLVSAADYLSFRAICTYASRQSARFTFSCEVYRGDERVAVFEVNLRAYL